MLVRLECEVSPQVEKHGAFYTHSQRLSSSQMSLLQIQRFHQAQQLGLPSIPGPLHAACCMLKDRNSIYKTVQGEELDKHQLILCAGKDTGKVLKMAIRVKKLEVVGLVIINASDHCSRPLFLLLGRDTHLNFNTKAGCYPRK